MADNAFIVQVDLGSTKPLQAVAPSGLEITSIAVLSAPAGFSATVAAGPQGQQTPLPPMGMTLKMCPAIIAGVYLTVVTGQSGQLFLGINYELVGAPAASAANVPRVAGSVRSTGSVNGAPILHLQNPTGSGRLLHVLAAWAWPTSDIIKVSIQAPTNLNGAGATIVTGVSAWMDTRRTDTIKALVKGSNFGVTYFGLNAVPIQNQSVNTAPQVNQLLGYDWYVAENKALEVQLTTNGAGTIGGVTYIWEEL